GASAPALMWTVQPPRVKFNPPIRVELPNTNGLPAGTVTETFCYNHDLEQFVSGGTARVSEDGSKVVSDPGFGLIVSGWGGSPPPPPPPTCADGCKSDECFTAACVNGSCQKTPINEGGACGGGPGNEQCGQGVCKSGACVADSDGQPCTPDDQCLEDP